jgi:hypothetical protein
MVQRGTRETILAHVHADDDQWFAKEIAEEWYRQYIADGNADRPMALPDSRWRASWSGSCARFIAYKAAGLPDSDPPTMADSFRFLTGQMIHDLVQPAVLKLYPGSEIETKVRIGKYGAGHADVANVKITDPEGKEPPIRFLVEIKSINEVGWRSMFGRNGEGPRYQGVMQAAVNAYSMPEDERPDFMMVLVVSMVPSQHKTQVAYGMPEGDQGRFMAQYTYTRKEYEVLAQEEIYRMEYIIDTVDRDGYEVIPRIIPDPHMPNHEICNPSGGEYRVRNGDGWATGKRTTWHCDYCSMQSTCHDYYIQEEIHKAQREIDQAVEAVVINFPGAREATPEEIDAVKRQTPGKWDKHPALGPEETTFQIGRGDDS